MTLIIGIDPGSSGGIAWQRIGNQQHADAAALPKTEHDCRILLAQHVMPLDDSIIAYLEKVGATPQMGRTSAFTFGRSYGFIRGLLIGLQIRFEEVSPQKWQGEFGLRQGKKLGQGDTEKHNAIKGKAQQFFPHLQITHAKAAALMISEYGARRHRAVLIATA